MNTNWQASQFLTIIGSILFSSYSINAQGSCRTAPHLARIDLCKISGNSILVADAYITCRGTKPFPSSVEYPAAVKLISSTGTVQLTVTAPDGIILSAGGSCQNGRYLELLRSSNKAALLSYEANDLHFSQLQLGSLPISSINTGEYEGSRVSTNWNDSEGLSFTNYFARDFLVSTVVFPVSDRSPANWSDAETVLFNKDGEIVKTLKQCVSSRPLEKTRLPTVQTDGQIICYDHIVDRLEGTGAILPHAFGLNQFDVKTGEKTALIPSDIEASSPVAFAGNTAIFTGYASPMRKNPKLFVVEPGQEVISLNINVVRGRSLGWLKSSTYTTALDLALEFGADDLMVNLCKVPFSALTSQSSLNLDDTTMEYRGIFQDCLTGELIR